jgi:hypothetical protein
VYSNKTVYMILSFLLVEKYNLEKSFIFFPPVLLFSHALRAPQLVIMSSTDLSITSFLRFRLLRLSPYVLCRMPYALFSFVILNVVLIFQQTVKPILKFFRCRITTDNFTKCSPVCLSIKPTVNIRVSHCCEQQKTT